MKGITLNGLTVISVRRMTTWRGPWIADVDLDPGAIGSAPTTGPALLVVDGASMKGTIDTRGSGTFLATGRLRVVGGGNGWDKAVPAQHSHNDAGVLSTQVYAAAGAIVGEVVKDLVPVPLGIDYVRSAGPASRVLADVDWWVDDRGITNVGPRLPAVPDPSLQVMAWNPLEQRAELACDAVVYPGTPLDDARIKGSPVMVRDVEQTWTSSGGSRATVWCSTGAASRLTSALKAFVRETAKLNYLRTYVYRVVTQSPADERLQLQAVDRSAGMPDTLPLSIWTGMQGVTAKLQLSSEVLVEFLEGDPTRPIVRGFSTDGMPIELDLDGLMVRIGGASAVPLVKAPSYVAMLAALTTFAGAVGSATTPAQIIAAGLALSNALPLLPPPATLIARAA